MPTSKSHKPHDVLVMWEDASLNYSEQFRLDEIPQMEPLLCRSVGRCIREDAGAIYLAGQEFNNGAPFRNVLRIPRGMIRLVEPLVLKNAKQLARLAKRAK